VDDDVLASNLSAAVRGGPAFRQGVSTLDTQAGHICRCVVNPVRATDREDWSRSVLAWQRPAAMLRSPGRDGKARSVPDSRGTTPAGVAVAFRGEGSPSVRLFGLRREPGRFLDGPRRLRAPQPARNHSRTSLTLLVTSIANGDVASLRDKRGRSQTAPALAFARSSGSFYENLRSLPSWNQDWEDGIRWTRANPRRAGYLTPADPADRFRLTLTATVPPHEAFAALPSFPILVSMPATAKGSP